MLTVGLVSVDPGRKWIGGRYYLQHLARCLAVLPAAERPRLRDVWWASAPEDDPFEEVRPLIERSIVTPPSRLLPRLLRATRRRIRRSPGAQDLFLDAGIDVLFPIEPCANPGIPLAYWMPDFQAWRMPELFGPELRDWYANHYARNGATAARIVVSSEDGLRDLRTYLPHLASKARVLHFCSVPTDEWWQRDPAAAAAFHDLPDRFFLLPNQFSHHKNHTVVLEAVRLLRDRGIPVVVACTGSTYGFRGGDYFAGIEAFLGDHDLAAQVRILGLLPRADQLALMRRAIAILQPSLFEGWSTVVEDAKSLGKELILSDIAVHREQAPERASFTAADDVERWAELMIRAWRELSPGPAPRAEETAHERLDERRLATGRRFVEILREAAA